MEKYLRISKYNLGIIFIYIILIPLSFTFFPNKLNYNLVSENWKLTLLIFISAFLGSLYFLPRKLANQINPGLSRVFLSILYGLLFAFPEEIIFRGIIQGFLQYHFENFLVIVLLSSLIFGTAHLPNGANSLKLKDWNWRFAGVAFLGGLPLGLIFYLTKSLLIPTLLHTIFVMNFMLFTKKEQNNHPSL